MSASASGSCPTVCRGLAFLGQSSASSETLEGAGRVVAAVQLLASLSMAKGKKGSRISFWVLPSKRKERIAGGERASALSAIARQTRFVQPAFGSPRAINRAAASAEKVRSLRYPVPSHTAARQLDSARLGSALLWRYRFARFLSQLEAGEGKFVDAISLIGGGFRLAVFSFLPPQLPAFSFSLFAFPPTLLQLRRFAVLRPFFHPPSKRRAPLRRAEL